MLANLCARPLKLLAIPVSRLLHYFRSSPQQAADPIRIGLSLSLTGPTSPAGKQVLDRARNLARRYQRQRRAARPARATRLL